MKCPSDTSVHQDITERKPDNIFLYYLCSQVENKRSLLHLLVKSRYDFRARNNHYGTIAHKTDTSATSCTSLLRCMKDNITPWDSMVFNISKKQDMTVDFSVLVAFITLTWIRTYICFFITYIKVRPLWKIDVSCRTQGMSEFSKSTSAKYYILTNIEIKFTCPTNKQRQYIVGMFKICLIRFFI